MENYHPYPNQYPPPPPPPFPSSESGHVYPPNSSGFLPSLQTSGPSDHSSAAQSGSLFPHLLPYSQSQYSVSNPYQGSPPSQHLYPNPHHAAPPTASFHHHQQHYYPPPAPAPAPSWVDSSQHRPEGVHLNYEEFGSSSSFSSTPFCSTSPLDSGLANSNLLDHNSSALEASASALNSNFLGSFDSMNSKYHQTSTMSGHPNHSFAGYQSPAHSFSLDDPQHEGSVQGLPPKGSSLQVLLLHGSLDVWIFEAKNLPNMDGFSNKFGDMFGRVLGGGGSKIQDTSDPYVSISVSNAVVGRTYVITNSEDPVWMQHFNVPVAHYAAEVQFVVKDNDVVGSQLIGSVAIPADQIYSGAKIEGCFPILDRLGKPCKKGATLRLSIQFIPIAKQIMYQNGVGLGPDHSGVLDTYFPLRRGGKVTLYQDAHTPEGCLPALKIDHEMHYEHGRCWLDIYQAITQARRLIYIAGWSVYHKVRLVRDTGNESGSTLGDLLKAKSQEGVRVLLLVWDDPTSKKLWGLQTNGIMGTHDEETYNFFKHSSVKVLLCPRSAGKNHSLAKKKEVGAIYTHHQKTVIVDSDAGNNKRKIIAFVGGLDLCDGRYDTPKHPILRTLQTLHKDDFHNPTFPDSNLGAPRQPWHDLHCKIDGPAAYDVLTNFEERWLKASKPQVIEKLRRSSYDDALLKIDRIPDVLGLDAQCSNGNDPETWHVQVFRSIDSNSVKGFPKDPKVASSRNLVCGKNVLIDMSIHTAYVKAIRAAQHFIYIENQYFLGSSYNWSSHNDLGANNLIPMEIALKIVNKIKANERFSAYIIIPMWPEGVPTKPPMQRILFWQNKTMQMMYDMVYKALEEAGLQNTYEPQDYLNFFCLGNREVAEEYDAFNAKPAEKSPHGLARKNGRFMIYVHSKGMIVDDEYVILGSANINQRSLEGTRDTEIAMGAYQPQYTWARKQSSPHGQIYGYRMSLWAEHIGFIEGCFNRPESLECVRRVRTLGESNWHQFAAEEVTEMKGHLLKYPVDVDAKGKVRPLAGCEKFPDVGGNIVGSFIAIQENLTI